MTGGSDIMLIKQGHLEDFTPAERAVIRRFITQYVDGLTQEHKSFWRQLWRRVAEAEPGEMLSMSFWLPRHGPFHRRHMVLEQAVFAHQDHFDNEDAFRDWLKIGAAHCTWAPGPRGGIVPLPDSTSYALLDDNRMRKFHRNAVDFLYTERAQRVLFASVPPALRHDMVTALLEAPEGNQP